MTALGRSGVATVGLATLLICLAAELGRPAAARAAPPPEDTAAISVYVETMPTSTGGVVVGRSAPVPAGSVPAELPEAAATAVERRGGEDAGLLERVATTPELGAPQRVVPTEEDELEPERTAVPAIDIAIADGASRIPWLVAALSLITAALSAAWAVRRRTR